MVICQQENGLKGNLALPIKEEETPLECPRLKVHWIIPDQVVKNHKPKKPLLPGFSRGNLIRALAQFVL